MALKEFKDYPDTSTPIDSENLNYNFNEIDDTLDDLNNKINDLTNLAEGNGEIDYTYVESNSENRIIYKTYGRSTYISFWLKLNSNINGTYLGARRIAKNLPKARFYQETPSISTDGTYASAYCSIDEAGNLYINPRQEDISSKAILGGFLYISE